METLGKHLFLILLLGTVLLLALLINKSHAFTLEGFDVPTPQQLYPAPINFKIISIDGTGINVSFNPPPVPASSSNGSQPILKNYAIIVAGIDKSGNVLKSNRVYIKDKSTCFMPDVPDTTLPVLQQPVCSFRIPINPEADEVTFKVGLTAIYDTGNSDIINSNLEVIKLGMTVADNINVYNAGLTAIAAARQQAGSIYQTSGGTPTTGNDQFALIKQSLGGYPDALLIKQETGADTLNKALASQLSLGILDINITK